MPSQDAYAVTTKVRVRTRGVDDDERWALAQQVEARAPKRFEGLAPATASWLARIEAKLDCLLAAMGMPQDGAPLTGEPREVHLSETGIALRPDDPHSVGDFVWLEMELPGTPPLHTVALARVIDAAGLAAGEIHLHFEALHELDRKAILDHSLEVQRRQLRMRSGVDGEPR